MSLLIDEAKDLMEHGYYERAIQIFRECLELEPESEMRGSILDNLGYCFLTLGWGEEAAKLFPEYLKIHPSDIDGRFFLASAYASLKWIDKPITELRAILRSDPIDVLARHDLGLCYRDKEWIIEALNEMKKANEYKTLYGNNEERSIVESSLSHFEEEIGNGEDNVPRKTLLFIILMITLKTKRKKKLV